MITEDEYFDAEDQYINLTDEEIGEMARNSADAQPALFTFIAVYYDLIEEQDSKNFLLQMVYSTWIAYSKKYNLIRKLTIEEVEETEEKENERFNNLQKNEDQIIDEALEKLTMHPQSELMGCLYSQIGDYFDMEELQEENFNDQVYQDAGLISGVMNTYINLLEKTRQVLYAS